MTLHKLPSFWQINLRSIMIWLQQPLHILLFLLFKDCIMEEWDCCCYATSQNSVVLI